MWHGGCKVHSGFKTMLQSFKSLPKPASRPPSELPHEVWRRVLPDVARWRRLRAKQVARQQREHE